MNSPEELAIQSTQTAEALAQQFPFDSLGVELSLRNIAVLTDRLSPYQYNDLPAEAKEQVSQIVDVAKELAPLSEEDLKRYPNESEVEYHYRVSVYGPLHHLQSATQEHKFDDDPSSTLKVRFALRSAGQVFGDILLNSKDIAIISDTVPYFWGNAAAAARRIKQDQAEEAV